MAGLLALLDDGGGLEAVEPRHPDVEQDHGELLTQQEPERLLARAGAHQRAGERLEHGREGDQVVWLVVD
jgi:hypothetical protein